MKVIKINMSEYKRINHFNYFNSLAYPYVGVTCEVDITDFYNHVKEKNFPFFLSFLYCVNRACNQVKEFRQRIVDNEIIEYDYCPTSHTVSKEDETYAYCTLYRKQTLKEFLDYAIPIHNQAKTIGNIEESEDEAKSLIFISTLPWINYTSLIQPVPIPADSNPRITWGKYIEKDNKIYLPVSVLCHHALVDGIHISKFYDYLNFELKNCIEQ